MLNSRYNLYPFQHAAAQVLNDLGGCAGLFMPMGTGKTRVALAYLEMVKAKRILIVGPLSSMGVWQAHIEELSPWEALRLAEGRVSARAGVLRRLSESRHPLAVLTNYAAFWRQPLRQVLLDWKPDAVVMDEAHRLKGRTTRQSRFAHHLADQSWLRHRLALTGSPTDEGLEDLFSIYRFIDPRIFGTRWADFDRRYLVRGGYQGYQIKGYRNVAEVEHKLSRTSFRISKEEALDLPERITTEVPIALGAKTRAAYTAMARDAMVKLETSAGERGSALASIVLTQIMRLQQITSGFIPIEADGKRELVDLGDDKLRAAVDLTSDALANGEKVVIFCRFIHDLSRLKEAIKDAGVIAGSVRADKRDAVIRRFHRGELDVLLVQISTGSESIDLTPASVAIFYSLGYSLLEYNQARDRLHRHGQKRRVLEYLLLAERSIDMRVYKALARKENISRRIMSYRYVKSLFGGAEQNEQ